jgi:hypothetical protein
MMGEREEEEEEADALQRLDSVWKEFQLLVSVRIPLTSVCVYLWVVGKGVRRARGG